MKRWQKAGVGAVLALVVLFFLGVELGRPGNVLFASGSEYSDLLLTHWPNAYFMRQSVRQDHVWPWWNPTQMSGLPFAANPLSGLWYPPNWLLLFLPLTPGFNLLIAAHLIWGGWGMMRVVRRLRPKARWAALAAGLAWSLTPKIWAHLGAGHVGLVFAAGWLPWIADAAFGVLAGRRSRTAAVQLALCWSAQFLADPRLAAYTTIALVVVVLWRLLDEWFRRVPAESESDDASGEKSLRGWFARRQPWLLAALLGVMLTAVSWLPLVRYLPWTSRPDLTAGESGALSMPWAYLAGIVWADRGGYHEWMTYVGVNVLVLAVVGLFALHRRLRWAVVVALFILVLFALGNHGLIYPVLARLPGATLLRVPPRVWFLVSFLAAGLAGIGAAELESGMRHWQSRWPARLAVIALAGSGFMAAGIWWVDRSAAAAPLAAFGWFSGSIALCWLAWSAKNKWAVPVLVGLLAVELVWMDASLVESSSPAEQATLCPEALQLLAAQEGRIYAASYTPIGSEAAENNLRIVNGVEPMQPSLYARFVNRAAGVPDAGGYSVTLPPLPESGEALTALSNSIPEPGLLAVLDAATVVSAFPIDAAGLQEVDFFECEMGEWHNYRNRYDVDWPRVYPNVMQLADEESAFAWLAEYGPAGAAVVGPDVSLDAAYLLAAAGQEPVLATVRASSANRVVVSARGPGLLVVNQLFLPGWRVWVDGEPAQLVAADLVLQGVFLEEGEHQVEFRYWPAGATGGLVLAGAAVCLAWFVWWKARRDER